MSGSSMWTDKFWGHYEKGHDWVELWSNELGCSTTGLLLWVDQGNITYFPSLGKMTSSILTAHLKKKKYQSDSMQLINKLRKLPLCFSCGDIASVYLNLVKLRLTLAHGPQVVFSEDFPKISHRLWNNHWACHLLILEALNKTCSHSFQTESHQVKKLDEQLSLVPPWQQPLTYKNLLLRGKLRKPGLM